MATLVNRGYLGINVEQRDDIARAKPKNALAVSDHVPNWSWAAVPKQSDSRTSAFADVH